MRYSNWWRVISAKADPRLALMQIDLQHVVQLARVELTPQEQAVIGPQLGHILEYIKQLEQVDVTGVEPTAHAVPLVNVMRRDEVQPSLSHAEALANAPAHRAGLFIVPPVIE